MSTIQLQFAAYVGIDWADKKHDIILQIAGSDTVETLQLEHRPEAIDVWANQLRERFGHRPIAVCLEQRKGPLIYALSKYDHFCLFPINPLMLAKYRQAFSPGGAKDDPTDAAFILDLLRHHQDKIAVWLPDDQETRALRQLTESRRGLVSMRIQVSNQLTANLKNYFPQALDCVDSIDTILACDFLQKWTCLDQVKRVQRNTLQSFYQHHSVRSQDLINVRIDCLKNAVHLTRDAGVVVPSIALTQALVIQLRSLIDSIRCYAQSIDNAFNQHPDAFIFKSLPGAGPTFAPRLLVAFGSNRDRFRSAQSVQEYAGIAPVMKRSGQSSSVHWRYACPGFLRQSFVEWAGLSIRYSFWAKSYYQSQRNKGKSHNVAVRALAFKWIRIIYRCWKNRTEYDEATYLFALKKHHSPLLNDMS